MQHRPRPRGEGVVTRSMWTSVVFVGVTMGAGTLLVLDASLPGGLNSSRAPAAISHQGAVGSQE